MSTAKINGINIYYESHGTGWHVLSGAGSFFTQSAQFCHYQRFVGTGPWTGSGALLCHYCGLTE